MIQDSQSGRGRVLSNDWAWKNEDIRCVFGCQVGVNGDKLSQINYECVCFSAYGKLGLIMRIDVSGYLCAGFDLIGKRVSLE